MAKSSLFLLVCTSGIIVATVTGKNGSYCSVASTTEAVFVLSAIIYFERTLL